VHPVILHARVRGVPARRRGSCTEEPRHDRNRNRKDKIRRSRELGGTRYGAAARQEGQREQRKRPIHELLTEATEAIRDTDPGDIASVLHRAWTGVCLIGAATEILAVCADADDYRPRRLLA
jgi:hypothetical protein